MSTQWEKSDITKLIDMYMTMRKVSQRLHNDLKELHRLTHQKYLLAHDISKVQCDLHSWILKAQPDTVLPFPGSVPDKSGPSSGDESDTPLTPRKRPASKSSAAQGKGKRVTSIQNGKARPPKAPPWSLAGSSAAAKRHQPLKGKRGISA